MAKDWYYAKEGQQRGPFPESHIRQIAAAGQLSPHDLVWHEGLAEWVPARTIAGLIPSESSGEVSAPPPGAQPSQAQGSPTPASRAVNGDRGEFPPWLAALLAVATLGLFSIWYTWRASARCARQAERSVDVQGRPLGTVRHPAWVLLLSYATLGAYFCYWVYTAMRDCGRYGGHASRTPADVTLMVVFPPYAVYCLVFKLPIELARIRSVAGLHEPTLTPVHAFLNPLMFLALPYLAMWYQELLNEVWLRE